MLCLVSLLQEMDDLLWGYTNKSSVSTKKPIYRVSLETLKITHIICPHLWWELETPIQACWHATDIDSSMLACNRYRLRAQVVLVGGGEWRGQREKRKGKWRCAYMAIKVTSESSSTVPSIHSVIPTSHKHNWNVIQEFKWTMYLFEHWQKLSLYSLKWVTICLKTK